MISSAFTSSRPQHGSERGVRTSLRRRSGALIAVAALVAAGCGGDDDDESADTATEAEAATDDASAVDESTGDTGDTSEETGDAGDTAEGTTDTSEGATDEGATEGSTGESMEDDASGVVADSSIRVVIQTNAASIYDPDTAPSSFAPVFMWPAYDRLIEHTAEQTFEPMLATAWETSEDGLTLTLTLREGVVFHDGAAFDSAAVKANLERSQQLEGSANAAALASIESIDAPSPETVVLNLSKPDFDLVSQLSDRAGAMISPNALDRDDLAIEMVGAGPFQLVEHRPGDRLIFERFEDYWGRDDVSLSGVELIIQESNGTRLRMVQSGDAEAAQLTAGPELADAEGDDALDVTTQDSGFWLNVRVNISDDLADARVREALNWSLDREGISEALFSGHCRPSVQPYPEGTPGYDEALEGTYTFDPDRAMQLLEEAGVDSPRIEMSVINIPFFTAIAEAVQAQWAAVGFDVEVVPVEIAQLVAGFVAEKAQNAIWSGDFVRVSPGEQVSRNWLPTSPFNPGGYADPEIEELYADAISSADEAVRAEAYQRISEIVVQDSLSFTICYNELINVTNGNVTGLVQDPQQVAYDFRNVDVTG